MSSISWPLGKRFAFTIIDDTDFSTVANTSAVYDLLADHRMYTTKTVWPFRPAGKAVTGGHTLERAEYRKWVLDLQVRGFEIGLHGTADGSSNRQRIVEGVERFREIFGHDPRVHCNHTGQKEAIYWGPNRFDPPLRWIYRAYRLSKKAVSSEGAVSGSPYFWGDLCRQRIEYVRNLVFQDINTLKMDPLMPFHDPRRPYVRYWFSSSNGDTPQGFCELISEKNQDRLLSEGGASIVYTHLGSGFNPVPPEFRRLIQRMAHMPGWFVPASQLLDHIGAERGWCVAGPESAVLRRMQWHWATQQMSLKLRRKITWNSPTLPGRILLR